MNELISNDTGKPPHRVLKSDIDVYPDGEGGIYLSMCWHVMVELGSIAAHLPSHRVQELLHNIAVATKDRDPDEPTQITEENL